MCILALVKKTIAYQLSWWYQCKQIFSLIESKSYGFVWNQLLVMHYLFVNHGLATNSSHISFMFHLCISYLIYWFSSLIGSFYSSFWSCVRMIIIIAYLKEFLVQIFAIKTLQNILRIFFTWLTESWISTFCRQMSMLCRKTFIL